jgi:hypothetical protein
MGRPVHGASEQVVLPAEAIDGLEKESGLRCVTGQGVDVSAGVAASLFDSDGCC